MYQQPAPFYRSFNRQCAGYRWRDLSTVGTLTPDPDGAGARKRLATVYHYLPAGTLDSVVLGSTDANGGSFSPFQYVFSYFDTLRRKVMETTYANGGTYSVTQFGYDALSRVQCTAVRLDPSQWLNQGDPCTPQTGGAHGPDRVTRVVERDAAGRPTRVTSGYGTPEAATEQTSYTTNGQTASVTDGNGNLTSYVWDGHDRQQEVHYPVPGQPGVTSGTDYVGVLARDADGRVTSMRLRDGHSVAFGYDALGRLLHDSPSGERGVAYAYDLLGNLTQAAYDALGGPDAVVTNYNALGQVTDSTTGMGGTSRTIGYGYDAAGNRTSVSQPGGVSFAMGYDVAGAMTGASWFAPGVGTVPFLAIALDDLGRRVDINRASSFTGYGYDAVSRLAGQDQRFGGTYGNTSVSFGYNPAGQIAAARYNAGKGLSQGSAELLDPSLVEAMVAVEAEHNTAASKRRVQLDRRR